MSHSYNTRKEAIEAGYIPVDEMILKMLDSLPADVRHMFAKLSIERERKKAYVVAKSSAVNTTYLANSTEVRFDHKPNEALYTFSFEEMFAPSTVELVVEWCRKKKDAKI